MGGMKISEIKQRFDEARHAMANNFTRMREDLDFSNPANPQQWPQDLLNTRGSRPSMVFDQTNQFINQVVNNYRQSRPQATAIPANSQADKTTAAALTGMLRHIDYVSRADIAWDWALDRAARIGIGWVRVYPTIVDEEYNAQEVRIDRVLDPLACLVDAGSTQPDASDATSGWVLSPMSEAAFKKKYPKNSCVSWDGNNTQKGIITICEAFSQVVTKRNRLVIVLPDGNEETISEDEYWAKAKTLGFQPAVRIQWMADDIQVKWIKATGDEIIEETTFPSRFIPLIPIIGNEDYINGERILCGMTRRMMDSSRAYNYSRTADIETGALQPKAPFVGMQEAIEGYETYWQEANSSSRSILPFNGFVEVNGVTQAIPAPQRQNPPQIGSGFGNLSLQAFNDLQASVGMYRENLGAQTNANSGVAIQSRQRQGDTATFHYVDNAAKSMQQCARIVMDMIPRLYDTKRQARMLGEDGETSVVTVDPDGQLRKDGKKAVVINPSIGAYDVQIKVGPSYGTLREETAAQITQMIQSAPSIALALLPMWAKMQDWPDSEKVAKILLAMAPPQVQAIESEESDMPPAAQAQMMQMQQQIQEMQGMLQQASQELIEAKADQQAKQAELELRRMELGIEQQNATTQREKAQADIQLRTADLQLKYGIPQTAESENALY